MTGDIIPYLLQKSYATETQIQTALESSSPLKEALIEVGIQEEHIDEAWAEELGSPAVSNSQTQLKEYEALAQKFGQPFVNLEKFKPEQDALDMIPDHLARRHNVIPIRKDGNTLYVAVSEMNNLQATDDLRLAARCQVRGVLATPEQIKAAIEECYQ